MTFAQLLEQSRHASLLPAFLEAASPEPLPEEVAWVLALVEVQTAEKQPTNPHTFSLSFPVHPKAKTSQRAAKEAKEGKMKPRMPEAKAPKLFLSVHARLVFLKEGRRTGRLGPDAPLLQRHDASPTTASWKGGTRKELKREDSPLCRLFGLNTRYADGAIEKAQAALDSARELGQDPRKVVFGGRKTL
jgi:hypothetical protein